MTGVQTCALPIYVTGDVTLGAGFVFDGLLVVRGQVMIEQLPVGHVVLLAEGDIAFAPDLLTGVGSLAAYSSSTMTYEGGVAMVHGVLVGRELALSRLEITYCDTAILAVIEDLPAEFLTYCPGFTLEWIDLRPRR